MKKAWIPKLAAVAMLFAATIVGIPNKAHALGGVIKVCVRPGVDFRAPYTKGPLAGQCPTNDYYHDVFLATGNGGYPSSFKVCVLPATDWRAPYTKGPAAGNCPSEYATVFVYSAGWGEQACVLQGIDIRAPYNNGLCPSEYATVYFEQAGVPT